MMMMVIRIAMMTYMRRRTNRLVWLKLGEGVPSNTYASAHMTGFGNITTYTLFFIIPDYAY